MAERGDPGVMRARLRRFGIGLGLAGVAGILLSLVPLFVWLIRTGQVPVDSTPLDRTFSWSAGERTLYRDTSLGTVPFSAVSVTGPRGPVPVVANSASSTLTTGGSTYTGVGHLTLPVDGDYRVRIDAPGARVTFQPAAPFGAPQVIGFVVCVLATIGGTLLALSLRSSSGRDPGRGWRYRRTAVHRWGGTPDPVRDVQDRPHDGQVGPRRVQDHPVRPYGPDAQD